MIILQFLNQKPIHGYQIVSEIRRCFGISLGSSSVYPLLNILEINGYVRSEWNMDIDRPKKVYYITADGQSFLRLAEETLKMICMDLEMNNKNNTSTAVSINEKSLHVCHSQLPKTRAEETN